MYIGHPLHHSILKNIKIFMQVERLQLKSSLPFLKLCGLVATTQDTLAFQSLHFCDIPLDLVCPSLSQFQCLQAPFPQQESFMPTITCEPITDNPKPGVSAPTIPCVHQSHGIEIAIGFFTCNPCYRVEIV